MELDLERCLPDPPESVPTVNVEPNPPTDRGIVIQDVAGQAEAVPGPEAEEAGQRAKGKKPRKSKKNPAPEASQETSVNPKGNKKGKEKTSVQQPKPKPTALPHERLKINMVHGDVLILNGGDFIVCYLFTLLGKVSTVTHSISQYTLTRSGMSIREYSVPRPWPRLTAPRPS